MTTRRRAPVARVGKGTAALAGGAAAVAALAAACVEIASGPDGAQSVRFAPLAQAIIAGDVLRDSTGAPAPVRAVAFDEGGNEITTTGFRYFVLPLVRDTSTAPPPLVIDSLTRADLAAYSMLKLLRATGFPGDYPERFELVWNWFDRVEALALPRVLPESGEREPHPA